MFILRNNLIVSQFKKKKVAFPSDTETVLEEMSKITFCQIKFTATHREPKINFWKTED